MNSDKSPNIDDIKKEYEYKIDPLDFLYTARIKYGLFWGRFHRRLEKFEEKIKEIKNMINNKGDKIPKNILDSYEKILKDMSDGCQKIKKKVDSDFDEITPILSAISYDYEKNKDKPGAGDIYQKISKEIIDKQVNTFLHCEKTLISYNDYIISLKKNLTN